MPILWAFAASFMLSHRYNFSGAQVTAARKLAEVDELTNAVSFKGMLYPEDKVIIFDLSHSLIPKRRGKRASQEVPPKTTDELSEESISSDTPKKKIGRPRKNPL